MTMDEKRLTLCARQLSEWYSMHFRSLPWRQTPTPYRVWVSEIMLQQTRIEAVLPYYERFMRRLPDVWALAEIPADELMKLWEGLGYYSRARNLQRAAQVICERYGGELPADYDTLLSLPGIGEYTAGAIASIAFSIPVPAVDGNVMRVLSRLTADITDVLSAGAKKHYAQIAAAMLPEDQPGRFNQALMELGETVCLPNTMPDCAACPLSAYCAAYAAGTVQQFPVRAKRKERRVEERRVAVILVDGDTPRVLLRRRPASGLLAGMWEFPNSPKDDGDTGLPPELAGSCQLIRDLPASRHLFTHIEWRMTGRLYRMPDISLPAGYRAVTRTEWREECALPSAFRAYTVLLPTIFEEE